jgi:protein-tyrosine phosphatase
MRIFLLLFCALSGCWADEAGLKYFRQIDTQVFAGSKPEKDADFEVLRSRGVKFILQAEFLPGMSGRERRQAQKFGIDYLTVPMNASPVAPREKHVNEALRIMRTRQPIYIHCVLGRDRTGLLAGLYSIYFLGRSKEEAYKMMREDGFRSGFFVHGLKAYFDRHLRVPAELAPLR